MLSAGSITADSGVNPCCHRFDFLLKKSLLRIEVLRLRLILDEQTGRDVEKILSGWKRTRDLENAAAARYLEARSANVTLDLLRSVSYKQFIDGSLKTQKRISSFGLFDEATGEAIANDTASRYAFLRERGMERGDRIHYVLRGDSLFSSYTRADGTVELNDIRVGPERRLSLLGGYFVPKTNFRDGLIDQLFDCIAQSKRMDSPVSPSENARTKGGG
jgi:hypothetical protein